jgi:starch synthase (maltosyl-transferring)
VAVGGTRQRAVVQHVSPDVEEARFRVKRVVGEAVVVEADVYVDGHDHVAAVVRYRRAGSRKWSETRMRQVVNDRWRGRFVVDELGRYEFTVQAWVDHFDTWRADLEKRIEADTVTSVDLQIGADLLDDIAAAAPTPAAEHLRQAAAVLRDDDADMDERYRTGRDSAIAELAEQHDPRRFATDHDRILAVEVDRPRAQFSAWYELFPRATADEPGRHGTFRDVEGWLPYVAELGFDILYLPPVHPIGRTARKGPNNVTSAEPDDVGSPWAIGSSEGGHKSVHPDLGTLEDFDRLVAAAADHGLEIALDLAFQCSPDHPYVSKHPEWFRARPDGTIQYAENPPKKYQDIYPFDFETEAWETLWDELKSIFDFWIDHGVRVFRVDNPHTKSLRFWEWCIDAVKADHPDVLFLSEAFTRPKVMYDLAKRGFSQSYTYFAWRNRKWEIEEYYRELTSPPVVDFFRPNSWPNTPDILTEFLQYGGRPAFVQRLVLAATLTANYGIYGPAFELQEHVAREPGSEEYRDSEKYQLRDWDLTRPDSLAEVVARMNRIRRGNPALHSDRSLRFHHVDNEEIVAYSKSSEDGENAILVVVNLDPHWRQAGWVHLDVEALGLAHDLGFQVHDLLGDGHFRWHGAHNYVELDPHVLPAHVFLVRRLDRTERDYAHFV